VATPLSVISFSSYSDSSTDIFKIGQKLGRVNNEVKGTLGFIRALVIELG